MKASIVILFWAVILTGCGRIETPVAGQASSNSGVDNADSNRSDGELVLLGKWNNDLTYEARISGQKDEMGMGQVEFVILDEQGRQLYKATYSAIDAAYERYALLGISDSSQLFLEVNYGGNDNFLNVLSFENGRVVSLLDKEVQISGQVNVVFTPRDLKANTWYGASQIFVSDEFGAVTVYRYDNGKFRPRGGFEHKKAAALIEKLLK